MYALFLEKSRQCPGRIFGGGGHQHTLLSFKNTILCRNVNQNYALNALLYGKKLEKSPQRYFSEKSSKCPPLDGAMSQ